MKNLDNLKNLHIFMIGIGGISMSGLCKIAKSLGATVSGSDVGESREIAILENMGVEIFRTHSGDNISNNIDLVVYSGAIKEDNVEIIRAKNFGISIMERTEFLGIIAEKYREVIAISGTHGKTTTTALIGNIFSVAGKNPTIHIGGNSVNFGTNTVIGSSEYLILEACEYRESFRFLKPRMGVITNIEADHLDYYKDFYQIESAFQRFADKCVSVVLGDGVNITHKFSTSIGDEWRAENIVYSHGGYDYDVFYMDKYYAHFRLNMIGIHNVTNSLYAIAVAEHFGIGIDDVVKGVSGFLGVDRRYQKISHIGGADIIIDYAHHPTEIESSINGLLGVYSNIMCIFQPHTYTRTLSLFDDFVRVLSKLPRLILYTTYPAREEEIIGGRAEDLFEFVGEKCISDITEVVNEIENRVISDKLDAVIILGAGDLAEKIQLKLVKNL